MATQVRMPQLGESVVEGTVMKWLRREGETIAEFDSLLEVSTDKVASEIPSPASGTVLKILVEEGVTVAAGALLAWIGSPGEELESESAPAGAVSSPAKKTVEPPPAASRREMGFISPVVARLAREEGVDLAQVKGTGEGGRITKRDVLTYLESRRAQQPVGAEMPIRQAPEAPAWETPGEGDLFRPTEMMFPAKPAAARQPTEPAALQPTGPAALQPSKPAAFPGDEIVPLSIVRRATAEHMAFSKQTSPHVTTVMEADMSKVNAHREANRQVFVRDGLNLTFTAYFVAAAAAALKAYPIVNSSWAENGIAVHRAVNIGMATSLGEEGLIVPVIKGADGLSLLGIVRAVNDLSVRARGHRLLPDEVKNGTFTITNHGVSGSLFATPIINQPQCAILGVGTIQKRVVVIDDAIAIRPMVYLTLTFDHRILDGASADSFLARVVQELEGWK